MKLTIISHTAHYTKTDGEIVGWGPTISEINHLAPHFSHIYHVAFLHDSIAPPSALPYTASNVSFVALPPSGGKNLLAKMSLLQQMPKTMAIVKNTLKKSDCFQLRAPTGIGTYLIPYLTYFSRKKGWYKYAGNWKQENAPLGYALQRKLLIHQKRTVTINGAWQGQSTQCLTFENPCLTNDEREEGLKVISEKKYEGPFSFCFVGRLEDAKGVQLIINALSALKEYSGVAHIHFVGSGVKSEEYKAECKALNLPVTFHGFLNRADVFNLYKTCHFLFLPSKSEGFPKVIAEAMNYGCIPIVSAVSSIGQYVTEKNGFLISPNTVSRLEEIILNILTLNESSLKKKAITGYNVVQAFTFERYNKRIITEVLN
ncbi:capsular polysaccharide biosynthesis protein [unidentified eubacterium SCB49]|nr:capsular polysaccharide biosynthesis protein [unidentified eubacterium SCB49]